MFRLSRPTAKEIHTFNDSLRCSSFSYREVGATAASVPQNANRDHNRIRLGAGPDVWNRAVAALRAWQMFDLGWTELYPSDAPIAAGTNVAVLTHHLGFFSLDASRIVYTIDEPVRFGFAYGTLREHAESGEERFLVEWNRNDDSVYYDLLAFSRPSHPLARLGIPSRACCRNDSPPIPRPAYYARSRNIIATRFP